VQNEIEDLRVVVRLTVEFDAYLRGWASNPLGTNARYTAESTFSGIDSFCAVNSAYRVLVGAMASNIPWRTLSMDLLVKEFSSRCDEFYAAGDFERRCRLLLDLFRIQIALAGLTYE
jgi:hypothetical protein